MNTATIYLSKKGFKELKKTISRLSKDADRIRHELRELDKTDSHEERFARNDKLSQLDIIENELSEKLEVQRSAKMLPRKRDALKVALGSVVELIDVHGRIFRYTLVDSIEANPSDGRISIYSPLGQNLVGKTIRETIEWTSGFATNSRLQLISIT